MITYAGLLCVHSGSEGEELLFISSVVPPLAEKLQDDLWNQNSVTVRYWITSKESSEEEAMEAVLEVMSGKVKCDFGAHYSELTGYLWTDERCMIGGHDLISRLKSHVGKWVILQIETEEKK